MSKPITVVLALTALALIQAGCETKTQTGALTGAAVGTAAGALIGGDLGGAAIGAGLGAIAGGVVGMGMDESDRRQSAQMPPQAPSQPTLQRVTAAQIEDWIVNNRTEMLGNLGLYQITASDLNRLNSAYASQQFSTKGPKLTTIQLAQLYGVICYFQSSTNPICSEPPALGSDAAFGISAPSSSIVP